jgi:uncharacterized membrane protein HdeD (DUF308 family)
MEVGGDVGVGITAIAWRDPTLLKLAVLVGSWAILHAIASGTIRRHDPRRASALAALPYFAIGALVLGAILIARPGDSVRGVAVTIGLLALLEGTREVAEAAVRSRRERRIRQAGHTQSAAPA